MGRLDRLGNGSIRVQVFLVLVKTMAGSGWPKAFLRLNFLKLLYDYIKLYIIANLRDLGSYMYLKYIVDNYRPVSLIASFFSFFMLPTWPVKDRRWYNWPVY